VPRHLPAIIKPSDKWA